MNKNEIVVVYGKDIKEMTTSLLEEFDFEKAYPNKNVTIGLKPNLVIAARPDSGATTHVEIITTIIEYLQKRGYKNIIILEGSWVGDSTKEAFRLNGYYDIASRYNVRVLDLKTDDYEIRESHGIKMEISKTVLNLDVLINLPVLKGHCQTNMTNALKNLKGCLSDRSKRMFHSLGLMRPIAALNCVLKPSFTICDSICGDLDFEEGGNPVESNRMFLALDSVLLDSYSASLLGFSMDDVPYIELSEKYGAGCASLENINIKELNKPNLSIMSQPKGYSKKLATFTKPSSACSACYANLIHALKRLDEKGKLGLLRGKQIAIGQDYRGQTPELGVGACCSKAAHSVKGCPPKANDIIEMIEDL